jgi:hypothetical protein
MKVIVSPSAAFYNFARAVVNCNGSIRSGRAFPNIHANSPLGKLCQQPNCYMSLSLGKPNNARYTDGEVDLAGAVTKSKEMIITII